MKRARKAKKSIFAINYKILFGAVFVFIFAFAAVFCAGGLFSEKTAEPEPKEAGRINLLLTGLDEDGLRTDLVMVASYDGAKKSADVLLIPENTRMYIGGKYQKISAAHALSQNGKSKGVEGTIEAVGRLTGIPLNYYIEFSVRDFAELVDGLGGVEFDVPQRMKYSDPVQNLSIDLKKGKRLLSGDEMCDVLRFVSYSDASEGRCRTQTELFSAFAEQKLKPEYIKRLPGLFEKTELNTNLTAKDAATYANLLLGIRGENVEFFICPGKSEKIGVAYWIPDMEEIGALVREHFGSDAENITADKPKKD